MSSSSANLLIFIGAAVVIVGIAGYFIYINLSENSPSGQLARSRLGLDKYPGIDLLRILKYVITNQVLTHQYIVMKVNHL
jgi:hypothetical protein